MANPLYGPNRLKLGVFGANLGSGCTATLAEGTLDATWPATLEIAQLADEAGIEAMVPVARWKGFGGPTNFNGDSFETYTWAAGLGAQNQAHRRVRHISCADHPSGGRRQAGNDDRSHHRWPLRPERGVRLVRAGIRHVRPRADGPRDPLRVRG